MIAPATAFFVVTFLVPLVLVGRLSLFKTDYITSEYVGFSNYVTAALDPYFQKSFFNSFILTLMIAPVITVGSYTIASAISDYSEKVQSAARFLFYVPGLISGLIMGLLWAWVLDRAGLINNFLAVVGIAAIPWLYDAWPARVSIAIVSTFSGIGGYVIMYAVTMHSIPQEMKDAARVDGASGRQYKKYIQLPMMMPTIMLALLLSIVGTMQIWESIYVLTAQGGPEGSTSSPAYEIWMTAFKFGKAGLAAAKGVILSVVLVLIILLKNRIEKWIK